MPRPRSVILLLGSAAVLAACTVYRTPQRSTGVSGTGTDEPVQVYLVQGDILRFEEGIQLRNDTVFGRGTRYGPDLARTGDVTEMPLDSIIGLETIQRASVNQPATVLATAAGIGAGAVAGAVLAVAIFGSCPTVYVPSSDPAESLLVAELFSHSVAPLLEARDVDVYPGVPEGGVLRLDLRNEALETHFINHLELLEVSHGNGETVVTDHLGLPLALDGWRSPTRIQDRSGRDARGLLAHRDGEAFATLPSRVAAATVDDPDDYIEVELPRPEGVDSVAVALRLRNSLLNTVFLYDFLLSGEDLRGVEWMTQTLRQVGTAVQFGAWYQERMGLHVEVRDEAGWRRVGRIADTGPIAWKEAAMVLPVPDSGATMRFRLRFVADQWRIDELRVATSVRRPDVRVVPVSRIVPEDSVSAEALREAVLRPDERYLETRPGTALWVEFDTGERRGPRSFLLGSQGYYTEWLRPEWLRNGSGPDRRFTPGDEALIAVLQRWQAVRPEMEARFHDSRLPVDGRGTR